MGTDQDIGSWIRRQLDRHEWTAADLARRLGVNSARVSEWINGKFRPSPESCYKLADAFNVDPDVVLGLAGHREASEPLRPDDPKARIVSMVRRVRLTPDRAAGLEAILAMWLDMDRRGHETPVGNGSAGANGT